MVLHVLFMSDNQAITPTKLRLAGAEKLHKITAVEAERAVTEMACPCTKRLSSVKQLVKGNTMQRCAGVKPCQKHVDRDC